MERSSGNARKSVGEIFECAKCSNNIFRCSAVQDWIPQRQLCDNYRIFVVERIARGHRYLYLVESVHEGKTVRQRTVTALGRMDALAASGELNRLAASIARHSECSLILSDIDVGRIAYRRIGGPLLFWRLWQRLGIGEVLTDLLDRRHFGFAVERAVFVSTLLRLFISGSDSSCLNWMTR